MFRRFVSRVLLCSILGLATFVTTASAAPITYIESASGDLRGFTPLTTFTIDSGVNTVSGTVSFNTPTANVDSDSFAFIIPAGLEVLSIKALVTEQTIEFNAIRWDLFSGSDEATNGTFLGSLLVDPPGSATFSTPLTAGLYNLSHTVLGAADQSLTTGAANYTIILDVHTVNTVPEPASLALLALAPLLVCRRRR